MLKEFHEQVTAANALEAEEQAAAVASARREIQVDVEGARNQLPILKQGLQEYAVFVKDVEALVQERGRYPDRLRPFVDELKQHLRVPEQVAAGISAYTSLTFKDLAWKDGRQVDVNRRMEFILSTRQLVRSYDGRLSRCKSLRTQAEMFLRGWLGSAPQASLMTTDPPPRPRGPAVDSSFEL